MLNAIPNAHLRFWLSARFIIASQMRTENKCIRILFLLDLCLLLARKLLDEGFLVVKLKSSLRKFYGRHNNLVNRYDIAVSQIIHFPVLSSFMTYHLACNWSITTDTRSGAGTAYPLVPELTPGFSGVRVAWSLIVCIVFCTSLFLLFLSDIVSSVLRFTDTECPFGIFKFCL
jgi:hypothetical protein